MTRISMTTIAVSLALICGATSAFAHAQLEKATPAVGGTVSPPSEIRLTFGEAVKPKSLEGHTQRRARRRCVAWGAEGGRRQRRRADRPDCQAARAWGL